MKTLIFGAGPIGQWIALTLCKADKDVTLLARGDKYDKIKESGIEIYDAHTGECRSGKVKLTDKLNADDNYDLIVVALRKSSRLAACEVLKENKNLSNVLFIGNDISGFNRYSDYLPRESILLGFPRAGGGYENDKLIIADTEKEGGKRESIHIGEPGGGITGRVMEIKQFFESAGQPVSTEENIDGWLKYHYAFIAPTAAVAFKNNIDLKKASVDKEGLRKYIHACREAGNVLAAAGYTKRQPAIFNMYYWLPDFLAPPVFRKLFDSRFAEVAIGLHARAVGSELQEMTDEFRELQKSTSVETPVLNEYLNYIPKN